MPRYEMDPAAVQALRARVKVELRQRMRGLRRVLPADARAQRSAAICARLVELPSFEQARTIVGYAATHKEADPAAALERAEATGKRIGLPRVGEHGTLELRHHQTGAPLFESGYEIDEPAPTAETLADRDVDLIIVPALAFDPRGHRIGYGHGYYDRLLPRLPHAFKVTIGYDFQLVVEIPESASDIPTDCIITDLRTLAVP
jgi:5-formyltetrahydrofolate cyclo-ligase